jgi:hypothetical protein
MYKLKSLFIIVMFCCIQRINAQNTQDSMYESAEMIQDFEYLHTHLKLNHPGFYKYTNQTVWDSVHQTTLQALQEPMNDVSYRLILRKYLSYVKCGHTQVMPSNQSIKNYNKRKHFSVPFSVKFIANKLIVTENQSNDSNLLKGTEIKSINGILATQIIDNIYSIQNADAGLLSMKNYYGAAQFATYFNAFHGEDSIFKLECILPNGEPKSMVVKQKPKDKKNITAKKINLPINQPLFNQPNASFRICGADSQTAILKIKGFQLKNASKLYQRAFEKIQDENIKYLVLDLRGNGGGNIMDAAELISYITKDTFSYGFVRGKQGLTYRKHASQKMTYYFSRIMLDLFGNKTEANNQYYYQFAYDQKYLNKKNRFEGALFCIIDNGSFSAASFVAAYAKHKAKAIMVGTETAGTESGCYAVNTPILELPLTKNYIRIPHYQFKHHLPVPDSGRGVLPDIQIPEKQTITNMNEDLDMKFIWQIILENKKN